MVMRRHIIVSVAMANVGLFAGITGGEELITGCHWRPRHTAQNGHGRASRCRDCLLFYKWTTMEVRPLSTNAIPRIGPPTRNQVNTRASALFSHVCRRVVIVDEADTYHYASASYTIIMSMNVCCHYHTARLATANVVNISRPRGIMSGEWVE